MKQLKLNGYLQDTEKLFHSRRFQLLPLTFWTSKHRQCTGAVPDKICRRWLREHVTAVHLLHFGKAELLLFTIRNGTFGGVTKPDVETISCWSLDRLASLFTHVIAMVMLLVAALILCNCGIVEANSSPSVMRRSPRIEQSFNAGWRFHRDPGPLPVKPTERGFDGPNYSGTNVDDRDWAAVTLPRVAKIDGAYQSRPWQGICWYRKHFSTDPAWRGKNVYIQFGAAMQIADVWINGRHLVHHLGGYLPFSVDVTQWLRKTGRNIIAVRLDNRDTNLTPPGKPTAHLDFNYPGGLYRGARLLVVNRVHISNPIDANIVAGGGVFVMTPQVSISHATISVKTDMVNDGSHEAHHIRLRWIVTESDGKVCAQAESKEAIIAAGEHHSFDHRFSLDNPRLWSPRHPNLYFMVSQVINGNGNRPLLLDAMRTRFGIRYLHLGKRALYINGEPHFLRGTNRHQEYPYIEYALSPQASARDAILIKKAGFNFVRLSHYPQDPAFLNECDKIGLMCMGPMPGWQQWHNNSSFLNGCYAAVQQMIRRDRNHPSIVFWETALNETIEPSWFARKCIELAHAEIPDGQCLTFGQHKYINGPGAASVQYDVHGYWREYGDWDFGGNHSTSRTLRMNGQNAMLLQAWNFQWMLNHIGSMFASPNATYIGAGNWCMFDYNRGYYPVQAYCGCMNIFRLPKFVYYFFQSQRPAIVDLPSKYYGAMVFPATWWTPRPSPTRVIVFSNCQKVGLYLNGHLIRVQQPDDGPDTAYGGGRASLATTGNRFVGTPAGIDGGGNCRYLVHAPFTFKDVPYAPGTLRAVGFINGKAVATRVVQTPGRPAGLQLCFDTEGIPLTANGSDAVLVHARLVDHQGTLVPINDRSIKFTVRGPGRLIGANPFTTHAGIASILLQADLHAGKITVKARTIGARQTASVTADITSVRPRTHYEGQW